MKLDTIYHGHNVDVLAGFPDACIDLTVTSPPYDGLRDYKGYEWDIESLVKQLYRTTGPGGVVVWVVGDSVVDGSETTTSAEQKILFRKAGFNIHDTMIYEKNGSSLPDPTRYLQSFEYMFVFSKGKPKTFNPIKDRKNRFRERWGKGRAVREKDGTMSPRGNYHANEFGYRFNIWRYNTGAGYTTKDEYAFEHPAMFPEALAQDHILSWSNPGDVVLDPFVGSGTTCKMAKQNGRHFVGIDCSPEYVKLSNRRIAGANVPLFVDA